MNEKIIIRAAQVAAAYAKYDKLPDALREQVILVLRNTPLMTLVKLTEFTLPHITDLAVIELNTRMNEELGIRRQAKN